MTPPSKLNDAFPPDIFFPPRIAKQKNEHGNIVTVPLWNFTEEPLQKKLLELRSQESPALRKALTTDLTGDFITSLFFKTRRTPPENINIEIKGQTRGGKSTVGISLALLLSRWWGHDFTVNNILPNQQELLYRLKDAKYGETFLVDEQIPENYGEGSVREYEQLQKNLNICAKKCNNLLFVYPPHFTRRNAPFGLEAVSKDVDNKYVQCFYYDLRRAEFGGAQIPTGFVRLPKFQDTKYQLMARGKWSKFRTDNFEEKGYDFDSMIEELYETKKNLWIESTRNMDSTMRDQKKMEMAELLAHDMHFADLKNNGQREAYIMYKINKKTKGFFELARSEITTIANLARVIYLEGYNETNDGEEDKDEKEI